MSKKSERVLESGIVVVDGEKVRWRYTADGLVRAGDEVTQRGGLPAAEVGEMLAHEVVHKRRQRRQR